MQQYTNLLIITYLVVLFNLIAHSIAFPSPSSSSSCPPSSSYPPPSSIHVRYNDGIAFRDAEIALHPMCQLVWDRRPARIGTLPLDDIDIHAFEYVDGPTEKVVCWFYTHEDAEALQRGPRMSSRPSPPSPMSVWHYVSGHYRGREATNFADVRWRVLAVSCFTVDDDGGDEGWLREWREWRESQER